MERDGPQFLIDSNIWLERLLQQNRGEEVRRLLDTLYDDEIAISEFSLYSVGLIAIQNNQASVYRRFLSDLLIDGNVERICLTPSQLVQVMEAMSQFGLDFDDGYQYVGSTSHGLQLVSFDDDFDDTDIERLTPQDVIEEQA